MFESLQDFTVDLPSHCQLFCSNKCPDSNSHTPETCGTTFETSAYPDVSYLNLESSLRTSQPCSSDDSTIPLFKALESIHTCCLRPSWLPSNRFWHWRRLPKEGHEPTQRCHPKSRQLGSYHKKCSQSAIRKLSGCIANIRVHNDCPLRLISRSKSVAFSASVSSGSQPWHVQTWSLALWLSSSKLFLTESYLAG